VASVVDVEVDPPMRPGEVGSTSQSSAGSPNLSRLYRGYDDEAEPTTSSDGGAADHDITGLRRDPHIRTTMQLMAGRGGGGARRRRELRLSSNEHTTPTGGDDGERSQKTWS